MDEITNAGSALEGAASKAHLSPTHGTRAARELSHGHAWTDTDYGGLFSQCVVYSYFDDMNYDRSL